MPSGRPAFTAAAEQRLRDVPTVREREAAERTGRPAPGDPSPACDERRDTAPREREEEPAATPTPEPATTATPEPAATATPEPTATATPERVATETPEATATPTASPAP